MTAGVGNLSPHRPRDAGGNALHALLSRAMKRPVLFMDKIRKALVCDRQVGGGESCHPPCWPLQVPTLRVLLSVCGSGTGCETPDVNEACRQASVAVRLGFVTWPAQSRCLVYP